MKGQHNPNQPQGFFMPLPFAQPPVDHRDRFDKEVPGRVRFAMNFIAFCCQKTEGQIAANDVAVEQFDGQELELEEKQVLQAACRLLTDYFTGKYAMNEAEEQTHKDQKPEGAAALLRCPCCAGGTAFIAGGCKVCGGMGGILCFPASLNQPK